MAEDHSAPARYAEIESWLRALVLAGDPDDPLPSEVDLASRFSVSRMTARQAVQNLAAEGLVHRQRGSGTYIAPRPLHRHYGALMSFSADMRRRGKVPSSQLLAAELRQPTAADSQALHLQEGERVVSISRLRLADGIATAIEEAALPAQCAPVLARDLEGGSLHEYLREEGREPAVALVWISARSARAEQARLLQVPARSALLVERRIIFDTDERPLAHVESAYASERHIIDAVFTSSTPGEPVNSALQDSPP